MTIISNNSIISFYQSRLISNNFFFLLYSVFVSRITRYTYSSRRSNYEDGKRRRNVFLITDINSNHLHNLMRRSYDLFKRSKFIYVTSMLHTCAGFIAIIVENETVAGWFTLTELSKYKNTRGRGGIKSNEESTLRKGARGKNDACIRWKFRFLIHAPVTHRWREKIEAIIEGWLVFDESLTRRERKRYGIDETSPCVRPCVQLKNKCRKSRARLSRKNEFSIQFFFALFTSLSPYYLYGLFLFCFCFFPSLSSILFEQSDRGRENV